MKLNLLLVTQMTSIAADLVVASFATRVVDSAGVVSTASTDVSALSAPNDAGQSTVLIDGIAAGAVAVGPFSGTVQALDASGNTIGSAFSFSGTMTADSAPPPPPPAGLQPLPFGVTVQIVSNS